MNTSKHFTIFCILLASFHIAAPLRSNQEKTCAPVRPLVYEPPVIHRSSHSISYDARTHNPKWVYECLTADLHDNNNSTRKDFNFTTDPLLPKSLQAKDSDYTGSGYDRGHLCPAADVKEHQTEETFYLTNICPQDARLNRGYWRGVEKTVRDLTRKYQKLHVFTGPLYLPYEAHDRKTYVTYQVIGKNHVAVPTHFFKVIFAETAGKFQETAYILPNCSIGNLEPLEKFKTTVKKVEKAAGLIFQIVQKNPDSA